MGGGGGVLMGGGDGGVLMGDGGGGGVLISGQCYQEYIYIWELELYIGEFLQHNTY